jgi:hypothetical protein
MTKTKDINHTTSKKEKVKYRIRNWGEYNRSLMNRGSLQLWMSDDMSSWWYGNGKNIYSDKTIEFMITLQMIYQLPLRQVVGLVRSLFNQSSSSLVVPDYTTVSRRMKKLTIILKKKPKDITDMIVDSTGIKVYGEGEWKVRKHGWNYRRTWKKVHIGIDSLGEIRAVSITHSDTHDMVPVKSLLDQETAWITDFYGDGAYDSGELYRYLEKRNTLGYHIPPQHNAKITKKGHHQRNQHIRDIRETDRDTWKQHNGYHTRSLSETTMYRYKTVFGQHMRYRCESSQTNEVLIKCNILNTFHYLCEIDSYAVV